jgi:SAM-dependent methyltransferase
MPDLPADAFSRIDESDDREFYATDRFVHHIDDGALATVERLVGTLVIEQKPAILDLMAGWSSHIPEYIRPVRVVGLGLNERELAANRSLTERVLHDLNRDPRLPLDDAAFDVVLCTVSVDYMTRPFEVFREAGRVLKPGGLLLVTFSNRMFETKAVKVWRESTEEERLYLVQDFFDRAGLFEKTGVFVSRGRPRPKRDKYAHLGIPGDPVYAVYAERLGRHRDRRVRPDASMALKEKPDAEELRKREACVKDTLCCPHCGERLRKWAVPQGPFTQWNTEFMYVCFNDSCPYLLRGWQAMSRQGNPGVTYRCMYNPETNRCMPVPVMSLSALKDGIVD